MPETIQPYHFAIVIGLIIMLATSIRILKEYERAVILPIRTFH